MFLLAWGRGRREGKGGERAGRIEKDVYSSSIKEPVKKKILGPFGWERRQTTVSEREIEKERKNKERRRPALQQ